MFIKWKPTVLYALFGAILAGGRLFFGRNLLSHVMPGITLPASRLVAPHVVVGRVLRVHGRRQLVRRVPLSDRYLGQFQGLGRHRPVPGVRAGAGPAARTPRRRRRRRDDRRPQRPTCRAALRARLAPPLRHRCSRSPTTAPSTRAMPAPQAAPGTFRCSSCRSLFRAFPPRAAPASAARGRRPPAASDPRAVDQGADAGRIPFLKPTTKDSSPMIKQAHPRRRGRARRARRHARRAGAGPRPPRRPRARLRPRPRRPAARSSTRRRTTTSCSRSASRQGQPDTPELRDALREELNTRELLLREAKKKGLDKNPDVKNADGPRRRRRCWCAPTSPTG